MMVEEEWLSLDNSFQHALPAGHHCASAPTDLSPLGPSMANPSVLSLPIPTASYTCPHLRYYWFTCSSLQLDHELCRELDLASLAFQRHSTVPSEE